MKREVVRGGVKIRITENGVRPGYAGPEDDSRHLRIAYAAGGTCRVHDLATRASLQRAGLMTLCRPKRPCDGFTMMLTKAGQRRAKQIFEAVLAQHPPSARYFRKLRNRVIHKSTAHHAPFLWLET